MAIITSPQPILIGFIRSTSDWTSLVEGLNEVSRQAACFLLTIRLWIQALPDRTIVRNAYAIREETWFQRVPCRHRRPIALK